MYSEKNNEIKGEIVEIIDEAGNQKVKILTASQYLEVVLEENTEIHLGEKVTLDITIKKIMALI